VAKTDAAKSEAGKTGPGADKKDGTAKPGEDIKTETPKSDSGAKPETARIKSEPDVKPETAKGDAAKSDAGKTGTGGGQKTDKDAGKSEGPKSVVAEVDYKDLAPRATDTPSLKKSGHSAVISDGGPFSVQIGSYYLEASKKRPLDKLSELGYSDYHFTPEYRRLKLYHVIVGDELTPAEAQELKGRLEGMGYAAELYGRGSVKAYSYGSVAIARNTQKKLLAAGFKDARIKSETKEVALDQLRVGRFSKTRAQEALRDLRRQGFKEAVIVRR
jgi:cell division septation protein DedD